MKLSSLCLLSYSLQNAVLEIISLTVARKNLYALRLGLRNVLSSSLHKVHIYSFYHKYAGKLSAFSLIFRDVH